MGQKTKYEMEQEKKYGPRFTGGDHLNPKDGFKYYLHKTMMANELHDGYGGYLMSNAVKALVEFNLMWVPIMMVKNYWKRCFVMQWIVKEIPFYPIQK